MNIQTNFFGNIEIDENKVIKFDDGIPGLEDLTKFLYITDEDENSPFSWLQSIENVKVVFTLINIFKFLPEYNPEVEVENLTKLGDCREENLAIYCIANIPKDIENMTVNLKAPIIINLEN